MKIHTIKIFLLTLALSILAGCAGNSKVVYDESAMAKVKKVAVLIYSAPLTIEYRNDATKPDEESLLGSLVAVTTANNGGQAATLAQKNFIQAINKSGFGFKVLTRNEMMSNKAYQKVSSKYLAMSQVIEEEEDQSALGVIGDIFGIGKKKDVLPLDGVGADGQPSYGLPSSWLGASTALIGVPDEMAYIKESIAALGVDAAFIINDQGLAFSCDACIAGTGTGSTSSVFLVSLVNENGKSILDMKQWFNSSHNTAAMVGYTVNPFQHDSLFKGHGSKLATVFVDYYKENGGE